MAVLMVFSRWKSCVEITLDRESEQPESCSGEHWGAGLAHGWLRVYSSGAGADSEVIGCWLLVIGYWSSYGAD
jgi:hypothetical protein